MWGLGRFRVKLVGGLGCKTAGVGFTHGVGLRGWGLGYILIPKAIFGTPLKFKAYCWEAYI